MAMFLHLEISIKFHCTFLWAWKYIYFKNIVNKDHQHVESQFRIHIKSFLKEINPRRSASKAPKSKPKKIISKGKCVSAIRTNDVIKKKKKRIRSRQEHELFLTTLSWWLLFKKKTHNRFFEPLYLFPQNLLNPDHVTSHIKFILIEEWLLMIFTRNSLATKECDCQYKSSFKKKKMLLMKRMIQICQLNKIKIVLEKHQHWGNPFLFVSFPYFSLSKDELLFVIHILKLGTLSFGSISICSFS